MLFQCKLTNCQLPVFKWNGTFRSRPNRSEWNLECAVYLMPSIGYSDGEFYSKYEFLEWSNGDDNCLQNHMLFDYLDFMFSKSYNFKFLTSSSKRKVFFLLPSDK